MAPYCNIIFTAFWIYGSMRHMIIFWLAIIVVACYAVYEQHLLRRLEAQRQRELLSRLKILEMKIEIVQRMLVRSPEFREVITNAPEEAFHFHKLH